MAPEEYEHHGIYHEQRWFEEDTAALHSRVAGSGPEKCR